MKSYLDVIYTALFILIISTSCSAASLQIVSTDGKSRSSSQISSYISTQPISQSGNICSVVSLIDCSSENDGSFLFNKILDTSFETDSKGLCLDMTEKNANILVTFDNMFSSLYCGSKAADFCGSVSNSVCILLSATDVMETLNGYDQIFRRILKSINGKNSSIQSVVFFVRYDSDYNENDNVEVKKQIEDRLADIWIDLAGDIQKLSERIKLEIIPIDVSNVATFESAKSLLTSTISESEVPKLANDVASSFSTAWNKIPVGIPRAILTPGQRRSLLNVEAAYTKGISQIESMVGQWQARVGEGKVVGKFSERVQQLLESVRRAYNARTVGTLTVRDRADRARQLDEYLVTAVSELFRQQLSNLQSSTTNSFRRALVKLAASPKGLTEEEQQQQLRKSLFDFRIAASDLEVESLGLISTELQTEVSTALEAQMTEFPETAAAKLEEIRKMEKGAKKAPKKKGKRAINIGLNLVGMLRPPGFGNLQGFLGYSTALLGLPLELLLGVHNDGDSPEVMGEDREYPILRLQPKINFDIDI